MNLRKDAVNSLVALCFCVAGILLSLCVSIVDTARESGSVQPSPFRIVWNYPDGSCVSGKIDLELSKYGIITNQPRNFVGDQVATLYTSRHGMWPYFQNHKLSEPVNGGVPQLANLTAHLEKLRKDTLSQIPAGSTGYAVIDQELWRTLWDLNYSSFKIFQWASEEAARRKYGNISAKEITRLASEEWNKSAREFMERSLLEAQAVRPDSHWGYYLYPKTWWTIHQTQAINDRMAWLYKASTGIYPSIYIKSLKWPRSDMKMHVESILNEAIRVRAVHGQADAPIVAYTLVQAEEFFSKDILDYAIGLPAEMGVDGVIIWGSSSLFKPDPRGKCNGIKNYVRDVLGPYVKQLIERFTTCSISRCGGRGRCVRRDYAQSTANILKNAAVKQQNKHTSADGNQEVYFGLDGYQMGVDASSHGNTKRFSNRSDGMQISTGNRRREKLSWAEESIGENRFNDTNHLLHSFKEVLLRAQTLTTEPVNNGQRGSLPPSQKSNANPRKGFRVQYTGHSLRDKLINVYDHYVNLTRTRNHTISLGTVQSKSPNLRGTPINVNNYQLFQHGSSTGGSEMSEPRLATGSDQSNWSTDGFTPDGLEVVTANHLSSVDASAIVDYPFAQAHDTVEVSGLASDEYHNYVCQCYNQWNGPHCEDSTIF